MEEACVVAFCCPEQVADEPDSWVSLEHVLSIYISLSALDEQSLRHHQSYFSSIRQVFQVSLCLFLATWIPLNPPIGVVLLQDQDQDQEQDQAHPRPQRPRLSEL